VIGLRPDREELATFNTTVKEVYVFIDYQPHLNCKGISMEMDRVSLFLPELPVI
jgi:hypothetical protein